MATDQLIDIVESSTTRIWKLERISMKKRQHVRAHVRHRNVSGDIVWEERILANIWHDEGEEYLVKVAFSEESAVPASHYIGLDD